MLKVLFLGYNKNETSLINHLKKHKDIAFVDNIRTKITNFKNIKKYDLIICFGYRHVINENIINRFLKPIINLHMSYLPFNKGAHPNFWSFIDETPKGVSIHLIDKNLDTGRIIYQKNVRFNLKKNKNLTFKSTYQVLFNCLEKLFIKHIDNLITGNYKSIAQNKKGSFHKKNELPNFMNNWNIKVLKAKKLFKNLI